jgi:hypothetical protein
MRIVESLVGRMIPVTRQKAGRPCTGAACSETASVPEVTASATRMVVFSSARFFSAPQSAPRRAVHVTPSEQTITHHVRAIRVCTFPLLPVGCRGFTSEPLYQRFRNLRWTSLSLMPAKKDPARAGIISTINPGVAFPIDRF